MERRTWSHKQSEVSDMARGCKLDILFNPLSIPKKVATGRDWFSDKNEQMRMKLKVLLQDSRFRFVQPSRDENSSNELNRISSSTSCSKCCTPVHSIYKDGKYNPVRNLTSDDAKRHKLAYNLLSGEKQSHSERQVMKETVVVVERYRHSLR